MVWALQALVDAPFGHALTFKGGTSLSKAYRAIHRFSEDLDITFDVRTIAADLVADNKGGVIPSTRNQERRWSRTIRKRLARWVAEQALPAIAFPSSRPHVMLAERTFWEKATAAHVFCHQQRMHGDRLSRHWYDLVRLDETEYGARALADRGLARDVCPPQIGVLPGERL